jgi:hypothetical protein
MAIHMLALLATFANALPLTVKLAVAGLIAVDGWHNYRRLNNEQRRISYSDKQGWQLSEHGTIENIQIAHTTVTTTFMIFLHIQDKPAILIANDALSEDAYRQFIVKLKMTANQSLQRH